MIRRSDQYSTLLCIAVVVIGLALFAYLGFYNRYWADDWCYNNDYKHQGVIRAVGNYFATGEEAHRGYSTNRYSLTLFGGLLYLPGLFGTQILASLTIVLWLGSLIWIAWNANRFRVYSANVALILASGLLLFYTLYLSPQRFQVLYWRSGVLPYSWTIIFGLLALGLITSQLARETPSRTKLVAIAAVSFLAGGFSEIGCVFLFSAFTLLLLAAWWNRRRAKPWAIRIYSSAFTAWTFLLITLLALVLSPSNSRSSELEIVSATPYLVPFRALRFAYAFTLFSLRGSPLPHAIFFITIAGLGLLSQTTHSTDYGRGRSIWIVLAILLVTLLLVVSIQAPTAYFYGAPPDPRGQSLSRFTILTGLAVAAWIIGAAIFPRSARLSTVLPAILLLVCCAYTGRTIINVYDELPGFIHRAQLWDERDAYINNAIEQGMRRIEIKPIDTNAIHTRDILRSKSFGKWAKNACGVRYYELEAMRIAP